jgi:hypothetical protein
MAEDFDGMVSRISDELARRDAESLVAIRRSIATCLSDLRFEKFLFTEGSYTLTLVAGQDNYTRGSGATYLPEDLQYVTDAQFRQGTRRIGLNKVPIAELRRLQEATVSRGTPSSWSWYGDYMIFDKPPSAADQILIDYHKDSTLSSGGVLITSDATTETNDWFTQRGGETLLRSLAVIDFANTYLRDSAVAGAYIAIGSRRRQQFSEEYAQAAIEGAVPTSWGL